MNKTNYEQSLIYARYNITFKTELEMDAQTYLLLMLYQ